MNKKQITLQLNQLKEVYVERGIKQYFTTFFDYIIQQFLAIGYTYKIDLKNIEYIPETQGLTFEIMTSDKLNLFYSQYRDEMNRILFCELKEKLNDSQFDGYIIKKNMELCGYCFINFKSTYPILEEKYVDITNNGYLLREYVVKKYRNQKVLQYMIYNMLYILKEKNYKTATTLVSKFNYPARVSNEKFGFKKCVICYFFKIGKWIRSKDFFKIIKWY